jgi:hypothetical protein
VGETCICANGSLGKLVPHPSIVSALICQPQETISNPVEQPGWPMTATARSEVDVPSGGHAVGEACVVNGVAGTLQPHPTNALAICQPDATDSATGGSNMFTTRRGYIGIDDRPGPPTARSLKLEELLRKTSIAIIQKNGPNHAFAGWHSVSRIENLKINEDGSWLALVPPRVA